MIIESMEEDFAEKHQKDLNDNIDTSPTIDSVKNFVARIDSTDPEPEVKGHKKTASASAVVDIAKLEDQKMTRERSFSETQALSVKHIVSKIETQYSAPVTDTVVTVTRSQSMPARSKLVKSPPLSILPSIDDDKSDVSEFNEVDPIVTEHCDPIVNANSNNNNNNNHSIIEPMLAVEIPDKIYEKDPMNCAIRTFTKDELQIIREVSYS